MLTEAFAGADPRAVERERRALAAASHVIATSNWTAAELVGRGIAQRSGVTVALPGAASGPPARGAAGDLLCVGTVAPHKGQDILLDALGRLGSLDWTCTVAGSRDADPAFAGRVAKTAARLGSRVRMTGVLGDAQLRAAYQGSGLLVAPSRAESFGMAIAEARSCGLPVVAARVGGIPESVAGGGAILVGADDPAALASALEQWMTDPALRARLRAEAAGARARAPRWSTTVETIARVLERA
jgi:glycosyltransferase involved in cell wall biosynthesis